MSEYYAINNIIERIITIIKMQLTVAYTDLTSGINSTGAPSAASISASQDHSSSPPSTSPTREQPTILPGVKLPKTPIRWLEANAYFASLSSLRDPISDINSYTSLLQKSIYEYFAANFGQISSACQDDAS